MEYIFQTQPYAAQKIKSQLLHQAFVIAYNFKGYDVQFIWNYLVHTACITPTVIMNGTEILSKQALGLTFIDSYNYLPFASSEMPSAFGFEELKKGYFPHFFNTEQNQSYLGPYHPATYYSSDDMIFPQDSVAIIPNLGYDPVRQFSMKACLWLTWMSRDGQIIWHAKKRGDINLGPYTIDEYIPESNTVYELYACY